MRAGVDLFQPDALIAGVLLKAESQEHRPDPGRQNLFHAHRTPMNDDRYLPLHGYRSSARAANPPMPGMGPLESAIMLTLWDAAGPLRGAEVAQRLEYQRELAYTTVMTVLTVLCRKGLAFRQRDSRAWRYAPALSRDAYLTEQVRQLVTLARDPESVVRNALGEPRQ